MIAKKTAASLIGQFRATKPPRLTRIDELPDQDLVDRPVPLRRADDLLDDDAVSLDHEALRHPRGLVETPDGGGAVVLRPALAHQRHAEHEPHDRADRDRPGPRRGHTVARHWRRSSRTSRAGSELVKIALPATKVSAPAACAATIVWGVIPPSTSSTARLRCAESSSRARRILPVEDGR